MKQIQVLYDTENDTWNVMNIDNRCIFYGSINELEEWLILNEAEYYEL
jgi:hypothetical protein